jgi:subtilisin family serine protease
MRAHKLAGVTVLGVVLTFSGVAAPAASAQERKDAAPMVAARERRLAGEYIVVLRPGQDGRAVARRAGVGPRHVYDRALRGFAASLSPQLVERLRRDPAVEFIEEDAEVTTQATQTINQAGLWGLDRIDEHWLPLTGTYTYNASGTDVHAYVIDTGIRTRHTQFGGRAANVFDAFGGSGQDCHGHGTHVAGTIGASTYGVAKNVRLRGVRVLNCSGSGSTSGVIAGVNWVAANGIRPAVANMSLGGGFSTAMNNATNGLANSGVFVAVAAGNSNTNACNTSPASASASGVFTTAASDRNDNRASFSNYGSCVDGYAPGVSVLSAWSTGNNATNTISGTSMATPHVAGVGALFLTSNRSASSTDVRDWIVNNSTTPENSPGFSINGNPNGTPNRLLYKSTL